MPALPDIGDEGVGLGVEQRFAAGQGDEHGAQPREVVDPLAQRGERDRRRYLVVLEAVAARQVAAPRDDQVGDQRARGVERGGDEVEGDAEAAAAKRVRGHGVEPAASQPACRG